MQIFARLTEVKRAAYKTGENSNLFMHTFTKLTFAAVIAPLLLTSCSTPNGQKSDWIVLFDGKSADAFRSYKGDSFPDKAWAVEDGTLKTIHSDSPVDLVTKEIFESFDLRLEWRISPGGNSGVMYHVSEDFDNPWQTGPEMQVLDDDKHGDGKNPKTSAGALYALIAPTNKHLKPVGEWNSVRLLVQGKHVEHWLNGNKIVEYELGSDELAALIAKSKFKHMPRFAQETSGHIDLQHHHDIVWYRNIKVRRL